MPAQLTINLSDVRNKMALVKASLAPRVLIIPVAEWLRFVIRQAFDQQRSPEGVAWATLSQPYGRAKQQSRSRRPQIVRSGRVGTLRPILGGHKKLYRTGALFQSVDRGIAIGDGSVTAASALPYAAAQNWGATISVPEIRPKKANGTLRWYGAGGQPIFAKKVRAHKVRIPGRPYLPSPQFAEAESAKVIDETLQDAMNKAGAA